MGVKSKIGWLHRILEDGTVIEGHTFNVAWGCVKKSEECKYCYAEGIANHYGHDVFGPAATTERWTFGEKHWKEPLAWNRKAQKEGHRHSVFCSSMADVYEDHPMIATEREKLWPLIEQTPWLNWLLLTKRPENVLKMSPWTGRYPDNVWIGTSVGLQSRAEERLPILLEIPAVVRFVSFEPMLEELNVAPWLPFIQWGICGGESGPKHRPFDPAWAISLQVQCSEFNIPFFFKQHGGLRHDSGGRILEGRTWDDMPPEFPTPVLSNSADVPSTAIQCPLL